MSRCDGVGSGELNPTDVGVAAVVVPYRVAVVVEVEDRGGPGEDDVGAVPAVEFGVAARAMKRASERVCRRSLEQVRRASAALTVSANAGKWRGLRDLVARSPQAALSQPTVRCLLDGGREALA